MRGGRNFIDLENKKFGRLLVKTRAENYEYKDGKKRVRWHCVCDCGKETIVIGNALVRGQTISCGCYIKELLSKRTWRGFEEISGVYWNRLQNDAKKRNLKWEISVEYAWELFLKQNRLCAITGVPIFFERNFKKNGKNQNASLDRIDSKKAYLNENIQWVHKTVNVIKWDMKLEELCHWCKLILDHKDSNGG